MNARFEALERKLDKALHLALPQPPLRQKKRPGCASLRALGACAGCFNDAGRRSIPQYRDLKLPRYPYAWEKQRKHSTEPAVVPNAGDSVGQVWPAATPEERLTA